MKTSGRVAGLVPVLALVLVQVIWSSNAVLSKFLLRESSGALISLVRFTIAGLFIFLPLYLYERHRGHKFSPAERVRVMTMGVVGQTLTNVLFYVGLASVAALVAGLIQMMVPIFTVLLALIFLHERVSTSRALGMGMALLGAVILITGGSWPIRGLNGTLMGGLILLMGSFFFAIYNLIGKSLLVRQSPLFVFATVNLISGFAVWPVTLPLGTWQELGWVPQWSLQAWAVMFYLVVVMAAFSHGLFMWALNRVEASTAASFFYLGPFFTGLMAGLLLGEWPGLLTYLCGALIVAGLALVNRSQFRRPARVSSVATSAARKS